MQQTKQRQYEKLIVWKEAHRLCIATCKLILKFPSKEQFGLVDQMRRASQSVPTNIVEGNYRKTTKDKRKFFTIAQSSLEELHYHYRIAKDLEYITNEIFERANDQIARVSFLLNKFYSNQG